MNCKKCAELISEYVDDCIAGELEEQFRAHISGCPSCERNVRATEALIISLRGLSSQAAPCDCWARVREQITALPLPVQRPLWVFRPAFAVPVLALLMLLAVMVFWPTAVHDPGPPVLVSAPEYSGYISAHSNLQRQQALADPHVVFVTSELEQATYSYDQQNR